MEENKFEKEVRQRMEELKIQPSASVWENVEKRIQKKNPRKKIAWLFFALLATLLAGGFYFLNQKNITRSPNSYAQNETRDSVDFEIGINNNENELAKNENEINHKIFSESKEPLIESDAEKLAKATTGKRTTILKKTVTHNPKRIITENENLIIASTNSKEEIIKSNDEIKDRESMVPPNYDSAKNDKMKEQIVQQINSPIQPSMNNENIPVQDSVHSMLIAKPTSKQKSNWVLGFNFSAGKTLVGSGIFDFNTSKSLADMSYNNPGNNTNPPPFPQNFNIPRIRNSVAFVTGVFAQKKISKVSSFSLGVNYKYFSTLNEVGIMISPESYYASRNSGTSGYSKTYRNNFHFVEIPFSLKIETRQNKKLPVTWHVGASVSQLMSSNALQYQQGILYQDNSPFNKTQIGINAGVSAMLFSKRKYPISIGPYFNYGINTLSGEGLYGEKHLGFIGLRTEILFKKNK